MEWSMVSAGGKARRNDDLARVFKHGDVLDVLVLDGATSLAERDWLDQDEGDPAWFVRRFADAFAGAVVAADADRAQDAIVGQALDAVRAEWEAGGGRAAPLYAWPLAALSWIRIRPDGAGWRLDSWCLGDCKVLLAQPDGQVLDLDPYDNAYEHQLQQSVAGLAAGGMHDGAARFAALMPTLRARREQQHTAAAPDVLCVAPCGPLAARRTHARARAGARLLAMSDGFYRLCDPYALYDDAGLMRACAEAGPDALLAELRRFEAGRDTGALSVKAADDATAVALVFGAGTQ